MAFIEWSKQFSIGVEEVDNDHRKLVNLVNKIHAMNSREEKDLDRVLDLFEELLSYSRWHFRHEERLMQNYGYPEFFNHKKEHGDLEQLATELYEKLLNGDESIIDKLMLFLKNWLMDHIVGTDMKMGRFLVQQTDMK